MTRDELERLAAMVKVGRPNPGRPGADRRVAKATAAAFRKARIDAIAAANKRPSR